MPKTGYSCRPFPTYLFLEVIVASEYNALTNGQKEKLKMILSCGTVDMMVGSLVRADIFTLFPEGTETYDNLIYLLAPTSPL